MCVDAILKTNYVDVQKFGLNIMWKQECPLKNVTIFACLNGIYFVSGQ